MTLDRPSVFAAVKVCSYDVVKILTTVQLTFGISESKFIQNYWYIKINFLVPENLFLRYQ